MKKVLITLFVFVLTFMAFAQNFEVQTTGLSTGAHVRCIVPVNANDLWFSAYSGAVGKTSNGGTNWTLTTNPYSNYPAYTMFALSSTTAWVSLVDPSNELDFRIAKTTDGGATWTNQVINANSFGDVVYFWDANNGLCVGDPPTDDINNWVVKRTTDGGTTWTSIPAANIPQADGANGEYGAANSYSVIGNTVWFTSYGASTLPAPKLYKTTNRGLNWTATPLSCFQGAGNSAVYVAFKDEMNGVVVNTLGKAAYTTDGGATWSTAQTVDAGGFRAITYVAGNTYVAGGGASATGIFYVSRDGGQTWTKIDLPTGFTRIHTIRFVNNSLGWIGGRDGKVAKWIGGDITGGQGSNPVVEFRVNMKIKLRKGEFAKNDPLYIRGSFNSWGTTDQMSDPDNDSIYSKTITMPAPGPQEFKFMFVHGGTDVWEGDPNRQATFVAGNQVYNGGYFNNDSIFVVKDSIYTYFGCNMELERLSGRFNPASDTVSVNGSFQGWTPKKNILTPSGLNPDLYEGMWAIFAGVGEKIEFKFWYTPNNWESISNRIYTFTQQDFDTKQAVITGAFNNGSLETVINQNCTIKFTCNTNGAINYLTGQPFASVNSVHIAGSALPLQWPGGGWPNSDSTRVLRLYDDGTNGDLVAGDKIFTRNITFPKYTVLEVKYKYGINWGGDNGGGNDNEGGFGADHTLRMTKFMVSATAVDTFGKANVTFLKDIVTDVKDEEVRPVNYELSQNYPNPFNPTTMISYSIPATSFVTLKVYDMLGREVATLVNEQKSAGRYEVRFDAGKLSSGMYLYELKAGEFKSTKKMLLTK